MNQTIKERQEALFTEYNSKMKQNDDYLYELQAKNREIDRYLDDIYDFKMKMRAEIEYRQSELEQKGVHEDMHLFHEIEDILNQDYQRANRALLDDQDEILREQGRIFSEKDDLEREYQRSAIALTEEAES